MSSGKGKTVVHGGFGIFNNWLTQANVQEEFRGSPPGEITPTFTAGTATPPVFMLGTSNKPPFGFTFPALVGSPICPTLGTDGCLNSQGGIVGANAGIGGINPNLKSPKANIWSATLEQKVGTRFRRRRGLLRIAFVQPRRRRKSGRGGQLWPGYQRFCRRSVYTRPAPSRLNSSFGSIAYADNDRYGNFESVFFEFKGRICDGTDSSTPLIPTPLPRTTPAFTRLKHPGDLLWSVAMGRAQPLLALHSTTRSRAWRRQRRGRHAHVGGWGASGTSIFQTGYPAMVYSTAPFLAVCKIGIDPQPAARPRILPSLMPPEAATTMPTETQPTTPDVKSLQPGQFKECLP